MLRRVRLMLARARIRLGQLVAMLHADTGLVVRVNAAINLGSSLTQRYAPLLAPLSLVRAIGGTARWSSSHSGSRYPPSRPGAAVKTCHRRATDEGDRGKPGRRRGHLHWPTRLETVGWRQYYARG